MEQKKTIIYIMSDVRSGSTLLENILSNSPDIVSVGELMHLYAYLNKKDVGKVFNWKCSCNNDFTECEYWSKIFYNLEKQEIKNINKTGVLKKPSLMFSKRLSSVNIPENKIIIEHLDKIYNAIFSVSATNFIVDSSKNEIQLAAILKYSQFNVKVIYLKRDIRAVVLSKMKWEKKLGLKQNNIFKLLVATKIKYNIQNKTFNKLVNKKDRLKLNYNNIVTDLPDTLTKIINFTGINHFETPTHMEMHNNHSVGGTPNRERRIIRYDNSWKKKAAKRPVFRLLGKIIDNL